jgi:hypothetical protein
MEELELPLLRLPSQQGRDYRLLMGSLQMADYIDSEIGPRGFGPVSPSMMWPEDRAWFIATEVDFDSTLIGGSLELIQEFLSSDGISVLRVGPEDSFTADADHVNSVE